MKFQQWAGVVTKFYGKLYTKEAIMRGSGGKLKVENGKWKSVPLSIFHFLLFFPSAFNPQHRVFCVMLVLFPKFIGRIYDPIPIHYEFIEMFSG